MAGLRTLPSSPQALEPELHRLERELGALASSRRLDRRGRPSRFRREREEAAYTAAKRLLAIERRRVVIRLDQLRGRRA